VLVINDDTVIDSDCIRYLVDSAEATGAAAVAPQILYYDEPGLIWYGGGRFSPSRGLAIHLRENQPLDMRQTPMPVTFVCGCCFLLRADVLRAVGGFDESFFAYVEDVELSLRLALAGYTMMYEPRARVLHRIKRNAVETPFQLRQGNRNRRRMVRKHYGLLDKIRFAGWFYPTRLIHVVRYAARGDWSRVRAVVEGAVGPIDAGA
jgi:GT2 family glycosyltransferase